MSNKNGTWLNVHKAAEKYSTNRMFIHRRINSGDIRSKRTKSKRLIYIPDLLKELEGNSWMDSTPADRFWRFVEKTNGCWEWQGQRSGQGYGTFTFNGETYRAHRFSYELATGEELGDLLACHHCDNPPCVNPDHLFAGTHSDNIQDAVSKGRLAKSDETRDKIRGVKNGRAKLSPQLVRYIRQELIDNKNGHTAYSIAQEIGVTYGAVYAVINGITWTHVK